MHLVLLTHKPGAMGNGRPSFNRFTPGGLWTSLTQQLQRTADARVTFVILPFQAFGFRQYEGWKHGRRNEKQNPNSSQAPFGQVFFLVSSCFNFNTMTFWGKVGEWLHTWTHPWWGWGDCHSDCCWRCSSHVHLCLVQCPAAGLGWPWESGEMGQSYPNSICPSIIYLSMYLFIYLSISLSLYI